MDKSSSLGMSPGHPNNIQEVQASKLGDAQGTPSSSIKNTRSFFNALYFYCCMHYVLFLERCSPHSLAGGRRAMPHTRSRRLERPQPRTQPIRDDRVGDQEPNSFAWCSSPLGRGGKSLRPMPST